MKTTRKNRHEISKKKNFSYNEEEELIQRVLAKMEV